MRRAAHCSSKSLTTGAELAIDSPDLTGVKELQIQYPQRVTRIADIEMYSEGRLAIRVDGALVTLRPSAPRSQTWIVI